MSEKRLDTNDKILVSRLDANGVGTTESFSVDELKYQANEWCGWADYVDTQYTSGSPWSPAIGSWVNVPNNGLSGVKSQEPEGVTLFENGKITGRNGDGILVTVEMTLTPTTGTTTFADFAIDIGGSVGRIYERTISFPKGQGNERTFSFTIAGYTLDTWEANGGQLQINVNAGVDIYGIRTVITRTHKAR